MIETACRLGLEGLIGKRRGSAYAHGRTKDWIKLKCTKRDVFVIGGYTWPDEARSDPGIGSLLVGQWGADGKLHYSGKVGAGYTMAASAQLRERLDAMKQAARPFAQATGHDTHATWVRPELVCDVTYNEWPEGGSLRHASFKGLRALEDKPAVAARTGRRTRGDRIVDETSGITKSEILAYYHDIAPWMLPHLSGRPAYEARFPLGLKGVRKMYLINITEPKRTTPI